MKKTICILAALAALGVANAATALINFGTKAVDGWATYTQGSGDGFTVTSNGITLTLATGGGHNITGGNFSAANATYASGEFDGITGTALNEMEAALGLTMSSVTSDVYGTGISNGGSGTGKALSVSGLTEGVGYTIYILGGDAKNLGANTHGLNISAGLTCDSISYYKTSSATAAYQEGTVGTAITSGNNEYYIIKIENAIADANGRITIGTMAGQRGNINAFAITEYVIPEASTASLGLIGLLALANRRKRR